MYYNLSVLSNRCPPNYWFPLKTFRRFFTQSYYDVLKVSPTCSAKEIREAFLLLSKQTHPDKHLNDPSMHEKFVRLNEAYSTLINPSSRRAYDLTLYNERKLNPPYDRPFSHTYSTRKTTYGSYQSRSSQSTNAGYYKDPFSWDYKPRTEPKYGQRFTSGIDGMKKFSNTVIVSCLLAITVVGAIVQILAIRRSFLLNQEKMLEKSHQVSLLHKEARERAKLYGNAHQIEVLKKNLGVSYDSEMIESNIRNKKLGGSTTSDPVVINVDPTKKVDKGKNPIIQSNEGQHDKPKGGKTGGCAIHRSPGYCAIHHKVINDSNKVPQTEVGNNAVNSCKRCKKCSHSVN